MFIQGVLFTDRPCSNTTLHQSQQFTFPCCRNVSVLQVISLTRERSVSVCFAQISGKKQKRVIQMCIKIYINKEGLTRKTFPVFVLSYANFHLLHKAVLFVKLHKHPQSISLLSIDICEGHQNRKTFEICSLWPLQIHSYQWNRAPLKCLWYRWKLSCKTLWTGMLCAELYVCFPLLGGVWVSFIFSHWNTGGLTSLTACAAR